MSCVSGQFAKRRFDDCSPRRCLRGEAHGLGDAARNCRAARPVGAGGSRRSGVQHGPTSPPGAVRPSWPSIRPPPRMSPPNSPVIPSPAIRRGVGRAADAVFPGEWGRSAHRLLRADRTTAPLYCERKPPCCHRSRLVAAVFPKAGITNLFMTSQPYATIGKLHMGNIRLLSIAITASPINIILLMGGH